MQTIKGYINYSKSGNSVSVEPACHSEIYDEVEIYIPDKYKISKNTCGEPLVDFGGTDYLLNDIIFILSSGKMCMYDMEHAHLDMPYYIGLEYK